MHLEIITDPHEIEEGDQLLIKDKQRRIRLFEVQELKEVGDGDFEVILHRGENIFYRDSEFVRGNSWVTEIVRVKP